MTMGSKIKRSRAFRILPSWSPQFGLYALPAKSNTSSVTAALLPRLVWARIPEILRECLFLNSHSNALKKENPPKSVPSIYPWFADRWETETVKAKPFDGELVWVAIIRPLYVRFDADTDRRVPGLIFDGRKSKSVLPSTPPNPKREDLNPCRCSWVRVTSFNPPQ